MNIPDIDRCPTCGALNEQEAVTKCYGGEDCPMCLDDDWQKCLDKLNFELGLALQQEPTTDEAPL